jgi:transcriptional regulator with XRE-family HTH domain
MPTGNIDPIVVQLSARRRELKMNPHQLALHCGFPASQIAMYESGARVPDIARLRRWALGLGMTVSVTPADLAATP